MTGSATQVHESSFSQNQDTLSVLELPSGDHIFDDLLLHTRDLCETCHVDFVVEMPDIADDCVVFHLFHGGGHDDVLVAGSGHEDIDLAHDVLDTHHSVAFHAGL